MEACSPLVGESIRVTGIVQGVGFRPTVWRLARDCGLRGSVRNDTQGVLIQAWGLGEALDAFVFRLGVDAPPLSRIDQIERAPLTGMTAPEDFRIVASAPGPVRTQVAPDAATCKACLEDVLDPSNRRHRYPFTNCTHCGPRLSIVNAIPYDRANTSMAVFPMCGSCRGEYQDPGDRRFHAQPNACQDCGPRVWLEDATGSRLEAGARDPIERAARLIQRGAIVAVKGIGGVHLACDACDPDAVNRLRQRKRRYHKPFALMARDIDMVGRYARVDQQERQLLRDAAAPVVLLETNGSEHVAPGVAHGQNTLGFMLPYTPLHHLLMGEIGRPIVLTSGNGSDEPQCIANADARTRLRGIADYWLLHDRDIVNRLDDSVARISAGRPRLLRRARGYAPAPLALPAGFERAPSILAMGGELKNTFTLLKDGKAVVSQHMGDLEDALTLRDYKRNLSLYLRLFEHDPQLIAVDLHPDYLSSVSGRELAAAEQVRLIEVQHHYAHITGCMAEHGLALNTPKVLGIALDGLGYGADGSLWGGEFLLADYLGFLRLACFHPVPLPGGAQAMREPWRNTYSHLRTFLDWTAVSSAYGGLDIVRFLRRKPLKTLDAMLNRGINSPSASSCGRLFDAVAAALGVCGDAAGYEGQAAIELEALAETAFPAERGYSYPWASNDRDGLLVLAWGPLWRALLDDLQRGVNRSAIAARFHNGVIRAVAETAVSLCRGNGADRVVLSGGVFQNRLLLEGVSARLQQAGLAVLAPERTPANDGGLSLGQAVAAAAQALSFLANR